MKVSFTKMQASEIAHKLCIVRDEQDLQDSYEVTEAQASAAADAFLAAHAGGAVEFDDEMADVIAGELENSIEIAQALIEHSDGDMQSRSYISSMRKAIQKLKSA